MAALAKLWNVPIGPIGPWTGRNTHPTCSVSPKFHKRSDSAVSLEVPCHHSSSQWHLPCHTQSQTLHRPTLSTFPKNSALILEVYLHMFIPPFAQQFALSVTPVHLAAMHRKTPVPRRAEAFVAQASRYQPSACTGWLLEFSTGYHRTQCDKVCQQCDINLRRLFDHPSTTCAKEL